MKQVLSAESASLEHIIISHWHHDHIGGVQDIFKYLSPNSKFELSDIQVFDSSFLAIVNVFVLIIDCKVWKYKRTDGDEPNTGGIQVNELLENQKFVTEGATLK